MAYKQFVEEVQRLVYIKEPRAEITDATSLKELDSLALTELCVVAEEELGIALAYGEVKSLATFADLQELLAQKGFGP